MKADITKSKTSNEVRRKQVVSATLKIISEKGVRHLTTAAIAHEVGMSEANLYRHFTNKEEILLETVGEIGEGLERNLEKALESPEMPIDSLKKIFMLHLDFIEKNGGIPRLVFSEEIHGGNDELKERIFSTINAYSAKLESIIKNGQKAGLIKRDVDPKASALTFIGMIQVTILRWSLSGFSFSLAEEGLKLWENYEGCISAKYKIKEEVCTMFVVIISFPPIKTGKDAEFREWFAGSNKEFAKNEGYISRRLLKPVKGGNYVAVVEHESHDTFMAMHNSPGHAEAGKRVSPLFDGNPTPQFYEVVVG